MTDKFEIFLGLAIISLLTIFFVRVPYLVFWSIQLLLNHKIQFTAYSIIAFCILWLVFFAGSYD